MSSNPLDRVAEQLHKVLPASTAPSTPHLSGAETPPPFAWGGNSSAAGGGAGGLSPAEPATPNSGAAQGKRRTRLAVLTSGGDSAGMNAAVRAVVKMAIARCVPCSLSLGFGGPLWCGAGRKGGSGDEGREGRSRG